jgi:hypothetical protein
MRLALNDVAFSLPALNCMRSTAFFTEISVALSRTQTGGVGQRETLAT